jgi:hypothetical protein
MPLGLPEKGGVESGAFGGADRICMSGVRQYQASDTRSERLREQPAVAKSIVASELNMDV